MPCRQVGSHTGGYDGFTFDITEYIEALNEIIVQVYDPSDSGTQVCLCVSDTHFRRCLIGVCLVCSPLASRVCIALHHQVSAILATNLCITLSFLLKVETHTRLRLASGRQCGLRYGGGITCVTANKFNMCMAACPVVDAIVSFAMLQNVAESNYISSLKHWTSLSQLFINVSTLLPASDVTVNVYVGDTVVASGMCMLMIDSCVS
jgi:hypothetical protein